MLSVKLNRNLIDLFEFYWNFKDLMHFYRYLVNKASRGREKVDLNIGISDLLQHLHLYRNFKDGPARRIFFNGCIAILLIFLNLSDTLQFQCLFKLVELIVMLDHQVLIAPVEISIDGLSCIIDTFRNLLRNCL